MDLDVGSAVRQGFRQLETLQAIGHAPDQYTYLSLLRLSAAAADTGQSQRLLTRMLETDLLPAASHFHTLLRSCIRSLKFIGPRERDEPRGGRRDAEIDSTLQLALSVPPSMEAMGLEVRPGTIDMVLQAHTRIRRVAQVRCSTIYPP